MKRNAAPPLSYQRKVLFGRNHGYLKNKNSIVFEDPVFDTSEGESDELNSIVEVDEKQHIINTVPKGLIKRHPSYVTKITIPKIFKRNCFSDSKASPCSFSPNSNSIKVNNKIPSFCK